MNILLPLLTIVAGYLVIGIGKLVGTLIHLYVEWMKDEDHKVYANTVEDLGGFGVVRPHAHTTPYRSIVAGMQGVFFEYHISKKMSNKDAFELARSVPAWRAFCFYVLLSILFWPKVTLKIRPHVD